MKKTDCPNCRGKGTVRCNHCNGVGTVHLPTGMLGEWQAYPFPKHTVSAKVKGRSIALNAMVREQAEDN